MREHAVRRRLRTIFLLLLFAVSANAGTPKTVQITGSINLPNGNAITGTAAEPVVIIIKSVPGIADTGTNSNVYQYATTVTTTDTSNVTFTLVPNTGTGITPTGSYYDVEIKAPRMTSMKQKWSVPCDTDGAGGCLGVDLADVIIPAATTAVMTQLQDDYDAQGNFNTLNIVPGITGSTIGLSGNTATLTLSTSVNNLDGVLSDTQAITLRQGYNGTAKRSRDVHLIAGTGTTINTENSGDTTLVTLSSTGAVASVTAGSGLGNSGTSADPVLDVNTLSPLVVASDNVSLDIETNSGLVVSQNNRLYLDSTRVTHNNLDGLDTGNFQHLTSVNKTDLTDGGTTDLHGHTSSSPLSGTGTSGSPFDVGLSSPLTDNSGNVSLNYDGNTLTLDGSSRLDLRFGDGESDKALESNSNRLLTSTQMTDLTDGGTTDLHGHTSASPLSGTGTSGSPFDIGLSVPISDNSGNVSLSYNGQQLTVDGSNRLAILPRGVNNTELNESALSIASPLTGNGVSTALDLSIGAGLEDSGGSIRANLNVASPLSGTGGASNIDIGLQAPIVDGSGNVSLDYDGNTLTLDGSNRLDLRFGDGEANKALESNSNRLLTSTQKDDLTDGGTTDLHVHASASPLSGNGSSGSPFDVGLAVPLSDNSGNVSLSYDGDKLTVNGSNQLDVRLAASLTEGDSGLAVVSGSVTDTYSGAARSNGTGTSFALSNHVHDLEINALHSDDQTLGPWDVVKEGTNISFGNSGGTLTINAAGGAGVASVTAGAGLVNSGTAGDPVLDVVGLAPLTANTNDVSLRFDGNQFTVDGSNNLDILTGGINNNELNPSALSLSSDFSGNGVTSALTLVTRPIQTALGNSIYFTTKKLDLAFQSPLTISSELNNESDGATRNVTVDVGLTAPLVDGSNTVSLTYDADKFTLNGSSQLDLRLGSSGTLVEENAGIGVRVSTASPNSGDGTPGSPIDTTLVAPLTDSSGISLTYDGNTLTLDGSNRLDLRFGDGESDKALESNSNRLLTAAQVTDLTDAGTTDLHGHTTASPLSGTGTSGSPFDIGLSVPLSDNSGNVSFTYVGDFFTLDGSNRFTLNDRNITNAKLKEDALSLSADFTGNGISTPLAITTGTVTGTDIANSNGTGDDFAPSNHVHAIQNRSVHSDDQVVGTWNTLKEGTNVDFGFSGGTLTINGTAGAGVSTVTAGAGLVNSGTAGDPVLDVVGLAPLTVNTNDVSLRIFNDSGLVIGPNNDLSIDSSRVTHSVASPLTGNGSSESPVDVGLTVPLVDGSGSVSLTYDGNTLTLDGSNNLDLRFGDGEANKALESNSNRLLTAVQVTDLTDGGTTDLHGHTSASPLSGTGTSGSPFDIGLSSPLSDNSGNVSLNFDGANFTITGGNLDVKERGINNSDLNESALSIATPLTGNGVSTPLDLSIGTGLEESGGSIRAALVIASPLTGTGGASALDVGLQAPIVDGSGNVSLNYDGNTLTLDGSNNLDLRFGDGESNKALESNSNRLLTATQVTDLTDAGTTDLHVHTSASPLSGNGSSGSPFDIGLSSPLTDNSGNVSITYDGNNFTLNGSNQLALTDRNITNAKLHADALSIATPLTGNGVTTPLDLSIGSGLEESGGSIRAALVVASPLSGTGGATALDIGLSDPLTDNSGNVSLTYDGDKLTLNGSNQLDVRLAAGLTEGDSGLAVVSGSVTDTYSGAARANGTAGSFALADHVHNLEINALHSDDQTLGPWDVIKEGTGIAFNNSSGTLTINSTAGGVSSVTAGLGLANSGTAGDPVLDVGVLAPLTANSNDVSLRIFNDSGLVIGPNNDLSIDSSRLTITAASPLSGNGSSGSPLDLTIGTGLTDSSGIKLAMIVQDEGSGTTAADSMDVSGRHVSASFSGSEVTINHTPTTYLAGGGGITLGQSDYVSFGSGLTATMDQAGIVCVQTSGGGKVAQIVETGTSALTSGTTTIPNDDTVPQNTEGFEVMTLAFTPQNASSTLHISVIAFVGCDGSNSSNLTACLFKDSDASAIAVNSITADAGYRVSIPLMYSESAASTSSRTYKVRVGANNAGTQYFNGHSGLGTRIFGATVKSVIRIVEELP